MSSKNLIAYIASDESAAYHYGADVVLRATVEERDNRISIQAALTRMASQRNRQVLSVDGSSSNGLLPLANALAKRVSSAAIDYSTRNRGALEEFTRAAETANTQSQIAALKNAIAADPSFGLAYIALVDTLTRSGQDTSPLLAQAAQHRNSFTPVDRARFDALAARIEHAPLPKQEQAAEAVLRIAPNQVDAMTMLGAERFLLGDGEGGERLFNRALNLDPGNSSLRQQLALGLFETRRFAEAEKILRPMDSNPGILPALATCVLLEGDTNRADLVFKRYLALRPAGDPLIALLDASWFAVSGRIPVAIASLEKANLSNPAIRSIALSQMAIWQLMQGDRPSAQKSSSAAVQLDPKPASFAGLSNLMLRGDLPAAQWRDLVNSSGLSDQAKQNLFGYGFFLNGRFADAAQVWKSMLQRSGGADLRARAMLAASMDQTGSGGTAQKLLVEPFVPEFGDVYAAISFQQMRRLLALNR